MAFGRRKQDQETGVDENETASVEDSATETAWEGDDVEGPFDIEDFDNPEQAALARLDLGSVLIPMPPNGQIQVEFNQGGVPTAIWVVTPNGRFTIAAYAAPKSPGLWREVAAELAEALRNDKAAVSIEDGPWGREVVHRGRRLPLDDPLCCQQHARGDAGPGGRGPTSVGRHGGSPRRDPVAGANPVAGAAA
jgi:hypothetical protein